jgi:fructokinase
LTISSHVKPVVPELRSAAAPTRDAYEFLVVGEALVDVVTGADPEPVVVPGGSPANVALGLGRLGHRVRLLTALGDDIYGHVIRDHLTNSNVHIVAAPLRQTAVATARLDTDGIASYQFQLTWDLGTAVATVLDDFLPAWLHVGSIGATLPPGADGVLDLVQTLRGRCRISYDPNCRPALMAERPMGRIERLVSCSDVVKLSEDDARWLYPELTPLQVAQRWQLLGPETVIVTQGANGALAVDGGEVFAVDGAIGGQIIDTVGAGDAFTAGLLHSLHKGEEVTDAISLGNLLARRVCERVGADPPWLAELALDP